jgi:ribosomal protein S13
VSLLVLPSCSPSFPAELLTLPAFPALTSPPPPFSPQNYYVNNELYEVLKGDVDRLYQIGSIRGDLHTWRREERGRIHRRGAGKDKGGQGG